MQTLPNIEVIFLQLGNRITNYESGNYLIDTTFIDNDLVEPTDFDYQRMMNNIEKISNLYPAYEVYKMTWGYQLRCKQMIGELHPRKTDLRYSHKSNSMISIRTSKQKQNILLKGWQAELQYYIDHLEKMLKSRKPLISVSLLKEIKVISLNNPPSSPKIRLLIDKKIFGTLLFELLYGQDIKGRKERFNAILKAAKKDVAALILANFLDMEGNPLPPKSVDNWLTDSPSKARYKASDIEKIKLSF